MRNVVDVPAAFAAAIFAPTTVKSLLVSVYAPACVLLMVKSNVLPTAICSLLVYSAAPSVAAESDRQGTDAADRHRLNTTEQLCRRELYAGRDSRHSRAVQETRRGAPKNEA